VRAARNNAPALNSEHVSRDAVWKGHRLFLRGDLLATVVPDNDWPGLWRVHLPDGHVSDMVNLTRAKDAAVALAAAVLNDRVAA
jgi:hypothetical protein